MTRCPNIEALEALIGGHADPALAEHLKQCPKCRARARGIEENNQFLKSFRESAHSFQAVARASDQRERRTMPAIDGFEIVCELHRGGQGVVYLARQSNTKRLVAIKMLLSAALATSRQRRRFEREIEIAAGLRHPSIVTVFESGVTADGWHWFAMEHVEGKSLDLFLRDQQPEQDVVVGLVSDVCDAVNYAHQRGIIHRDLKPANILVDQEGHPHVLDFGLAKVAGSTVPEMELVTTRTGEFMGTFAYAAPEQFRGANGEVDTRTDVYALGIILYEAVTGHHPFPATGSLPDYIKAVDHREAVRPSLSSTAIGSELEAVMLRALATEPDRRYQTAGALGDDLRRCLSGEPVEARRDSRWYLLRKAAHRHRLTVTIAASFALLVLGFAVFSIHQARRIALERDRAVIAEHATSQSAKSLEAALRKSNIERGRLLARSGNVPLAEAMLRAEWHASPADIMRLTGELPDDDAYWALWELYAASPCRRTIQLSPDATPRTVIGASGTLLAVAMNRSIWLATLPNIESLREFGLAQSPITSLRFVPHTNMVASSNEMGQVELWDISTGQKKQAIDCGADFIRNISFTPDGNDVIVNTGNHHVIVKTLDGKSWEISAPGSDEVNFVDTARSGRRIVFGGSNDTATVIDLDHPDRPLVLPTPRGARKDVYVVRFSPDGTQVALGREDGSTEIWDLEGPNRIWGGRIHRATTGALAYADDGLRLASGGHDRSIQLVSTTDGRIIHSLYGHTGAITGLKFLQNGDKLVSAATDASIKIWDTDEEPGITRIPGNGRTIFGVAFSADGTQLAFTSGGGTDPIQVLDIKTLKRVRAFGGHRGVVTSAAFSPDGSLLATSGYDHDVRIWNLSDGTLKAILKGHDNFVEGIAFLSDGKRLISAGDDPALRVWDVDSHECLAILRGGSGRCPMMTISPDERIVATCGTDGAVRSWSIGDGTQLDVIAGNLPAQRAVCFSQDGKTLVSGGDDATIRVWDVATRQCVASLSGSDQDIFGLAMSPDGRFLASATRGGVLQLWSIKRRRLLATLLRNPLPLFCIRFSPDGKTLATCGEDGFVRLIDLCHFEEHIRGSQSLN